MPSENNMKSLEFPVDVFILPVLFIFAVISFVALVSLI